MEARKEATFLNDLVDGVNQRVVITMTLMVPLTKLMLFQYCLFWGSDVLDENSFTPKN